MPERQRRARPGTIAAAVLLALIVAGGIVLAVTSGGAHKSLRTPHQTTAAARPAGGGCSLPAGAQIIPAQSPPAVSGWAQTGTMMVPAAPATLGPARTSGQWRTCFAHNPAGALLAAINFWAATTGADDIDVLRHLAVDYNARAQKHQRLPTGLTLAGYQYVSYTGQLATVEVVLDVYQRGAIQLTTPMQWQPALGDWRFKTPAAGTVAGSIVDQGLQGYVPWSLP